MNIVVDQIVAVLQVLTFGNTVRGNQNVDFGRIVRHEYILALGNRGEAGQHIIERCFQAANGRFAVRTAGNHRRVQSMARFHTSADLIVQVVCRVRKRRKNDDLPVARIDRMGDLIVQQMKERLKLAVMLRGDVVHHQKQQLQILRVLRQLASP